MLDSFRRKDKVENKYAEVMDLYKESEDFTRKRKNRRLVGVA
jgi:hypothetical protein